MPDRDRLRALAEAGKELLAGLRYGRPPQQARSLSRDEQRARSSRPELWPEFLAPPLVEVIA